MPDNAFPKWTLFFIGAVLLTCFIVWLTFRSAYETPQNVRDITAARLVSEGVKEIVGNSGKRYGLEKYLDLYKAGAITDSDLQLTNFYFNTVRVAGCFLGTPGGSPTDQESVFSVEALRLACQGGARAFVFDIWPSMDIQGGFRPILQLVEEGSTWRRISMNTMEFETAVEAIVTQIYGGGLMGSERNTKKDLTLFYLRFCGVPRPQTYKAVANALAKHTQPYLLEPSYSSARMATTLVGKNLRELQGKIVILANKSKKDLIDHPDFFSFVNMCAPDTSDTSSIPIEYKLEDLMNLTDADKSRKIGFIQNNITFLILPTHDKRMFTNEWNWIDAYNLGIHCIPMNIFKRENVQSQNYYANFDRYSYKWKDTPVKFATTTSNLRRVQGFQNPVSLRRKVVLLPEPNIPEDPGFKDGTLTISAEFQDGDRCAQAVRDVRKYAEEIQAKVQTYMRETAKEDTRGSSPEIQRNHAETRRKYVEDNLKKLQDYIASRSKTFAEFKCAMVNYRDDDTAIQKIVKDLVKALDVLK